LFAEIAKRDVDIVKDLYVIAEEPDRLNDDGGMSCVAEG
jgi:hypothetical protein